MSSDEMLSWLRSVIEGDKASAEKARGEVWTAYEEPWEKGEWAMIKVGESGRDGDSCGCCTTGCLDPDRAVHIAIHDPRDTTARCEAELALLALHDDLHDCPTKTSSQVFPAGDRDEIPCPVVRLLVLARRHRAGFKPEWVEG